MFLPLPYAQFSWPYVVLPPENIFNDLETLFLKDDLDRLIIEALFANISATTLGLQAAAILRPPIVPVDGRAKVRTNKFIHTIAPEHRKRTDRSSRTTLYGGASAKFQWVQGELIGKGSYGQVYTALNATTGELIAVKQVDLLQEASYMNKSISLAVLEMVYETWRSVDHPNIVHCLGFEVTPAHLNM